MDEHEFDTVTINCYECCSGCQMNVCTNCGLFEDSDDITDKCVPVLQLPICNNCEEPITGTPIHDDGDLYWLPKNQRRTWCSEECHENEAEAQGLSRYEEV